LSAPEFRIADTFTASLSQLTGEEQKAVKTTAFDLQMNAASPGMSFHKLDKSKDKNFWSVRVSADIRLIVHRTTNSLTLCYVGHHDRAYSWAERRKLETHPRTGAAQLVELRETYQEVVVPVYVQQELPAPPKPLLFAGTSDNELLGYGVPEEWLDDVRKADEDGLLLLAEHLPAEAAEALLELATGGKPRVAVPASAVRNPFDHPDAQRRFRIMTNVDELERALDFPWERWTVFLHPEQREWVERDYTGPARVTGSAGTGKTIVALHRAVHLARQHHDARVLLATFSNALASALRTQLRRLVGNEPRIAERIDITSLDALGLRLHKALLGPVKLVEPQTVRNVMREAATEIGDHRFSLSFLMTEWEQVVDGWQLQTWEAYRDVARLGRKTRLSEAQRKTLWAIFERVRRALRERNLTTHAAVFEALATSMSETRSSPYDHAVIDEAQDVSVTQFRFLAAMLGERSDGLFFAGDLGQRIFQQPFSWRSLGVEIRGRSRTLRVNYRTSHQIRQRADRLLGPEIVDVDGNVEDRSDTISVFNGPPPVIRVVASAVEEREIVGQWLREQTRADVQPHEIGVFVRSSAELDRATAAVQVAGMTWKVLDDHVEAMSGHLSVCTMHLAKGLEFRAVAVMGCDDEIIPLQERIETVGDDSDLKEVYDTERYLLYVACTRARDELLITGVDPASEFLDDLRT
jgi:hypothetical protein